MSEESSNTTAESKEFIAPGKKDAVVAAVLCFIVCCIPGFGQIYLGQTGKGIVLIGISLFSWILIGFLTFISTLISILPLIGWVIGSAASFLCMLIFVIPHSLAVYEAIVVCGMLNRGERVPVNYWAVPLLNKMFNR